MYCGDYYVRWTACTVVITMSGGGRLYARVRVIAFIAPLLLNCAERLHFGALREIHSYLFEYCS